MQIKFIKPKFKGFELIPFLVIVFILIISAVTSYVVINQGTGGYKTRADVTCSYRTTSSTCTTHAECIWDASNKKCKNRIAEGQRCLLLSSAVPCKIGLTCVDDPNSTATANGLCSGGPLPATCGVVGKKCCGTPPSYCIGNLNPVNTTTGNPNTCMCQNFPTDNCALGVGTGGFCGQRSANATNCAGKYVPCRNATDTCVNQVCVAKTTDPKPTNPAPPYNPPPPSNPATPTETPTTVTPIVTPTVTPTVHPVTTGDATLAFTLKLQGVTGNPRGSKTVPFKVKLKNATKTTDYVTGTLTADSSGKWTGSVVFPATEVGTATRYSIYIKVGKHFQKRICATSPSESPDGTYSCSDNEIPLAAGVNNLDFSGILQLVGDLPVNSGLQNGVADSLDVSYILNRLRSTVTSELAIGDLNFDGIIDTQDRSLIIQSLNVKYDDE